MKTKDPAFLMYSKDWLEGTAEYMPDEKGVYIDLLCHQHQKGSLPCDKIRLARMTGLSVEQFSKIWEIINVHFDDGSVSYPDGLTVVRLNVTDASNPSLWTITSTDDSEFQTAQHPIDIGRKSMGTEFKKNPGSNWTDGFDPTGKPWASEHDIYLVLSKNLKLGKTYTISSSNLAANGTEWTFTYNPDIQRSEAIHVNTVGYAADAPKFGYIYQWMGDLGGLSLTEYASGKFRIYQEGKLHPCSISGFSQGRKH